MAIRPINAMPKKFANPAPVATESTTASVESSTPTT